MKIAQVLFENRLVLGVVDEEKIFPVAGCDDMIDLIRSGENPIFRVTIPII